MSKALISFAASIALLLSACAADNNAVSGVQTVSETETEENKQEVTSMTYTIDPEKPVIALTFDDGPNTSTTVQVVSLIQISEPTRPY